MHYEQMCCIQNLDFNVLFCLIQNNILTEYILTKTQNVNLHSETKKFSKVKVAVWPLNM